jgi:sulfur-oxidizing protein SoxY
MLQTKMTTRRIAMTGATAATLAAFFAPGIRAARADGAVVPADASLYPAAAFSQKTQEAATKAMFNMTAAVSDQISLDAPDIAENGAVVPLSISTALPGVTAIAILALGNPNTIAAAYQLPAGTKAAVSSRIKLAKTTDVVVLVQAGGKLYSTSKNVKVTLGGCGG